MPKKQIRLVKINESRHMVITPPLVLSFPQLFEARSFEDNPEGKKTYRADFIADSLEVFKEPYEGKAKQTVSMMQAVVNAKKDQWGTDKAKWPKFNYPVFKKGSERKNSEDEVYQGYEGKVFITASSDEKYRPLVIDKKGNPLEEGDVYGGMIVRAQLIARPYAFGKNFGVRFILKQVMKIEDGERFGGIANNVFDLEDSDDEDFESDTDTDNDEDEDEDF